MITPPDPLTVETRLRWDGTHPDMLYAGRVYMGTVYQEDDGSGCCLWASWPTGAPYTAHPTEAEARAALIAAAMEDLQDVG